MPLVITLLSLPSLVALFALAEFVMVKRVMQQREKRDGPRMRSGKGAADGPRMGPL